MLIEEGSIRLHSELKMEYPRLVDSDGLGFFQRLMARIDRISVGKGLFLGFCRKHGEYYVDYRHTNDDIRCPICFKSWLSEWGTTLS
jgi:hypothetical protein